LDRPVASFDLLLKTKTGKEWCNLTIQFVRAPESNGRHAVHMVRRLDIHKLIEELGRLMIGIQKTESSEAAVMLVSSSFAASASVKLSVREKEVLELLANGNSTVTIAEQLFISTATAIITFNASWENWTLIVAWR
jgi:ATP/maltotriose-dependent transcriptional regulator MalT